MSSAIPYLFYHDFSVIIFITMQVRFISQKITVLILCTLFIIPSFGNNLHKEKCESTGNCTCVDSVNNNHSNHTEIHKPIEIIPIINIHEISKNMDSHKMCQLCGFTENKNTIHIKILRDDIDTQYIEYVYQLSNTIKYKLLSNSLPIYNHCKELSTVKLLC